MRAALTNTAIYCICSRRKRRLGDDLNGRGKSSPFVVYTEKIVSLNMSETTEKPEVRINDFPILHPDPEHIAC
ncbi:hypothetical protein CDAR_570951 [Caerostris darwini]|uniref:Uncharacterized protein n=1 Tax=Caerostris darwini TaxID=1538125 RepID=A0AAV4P2V2_9ARAC|nr:hypothetical protein CDAR_570951 [Caerostris darwini]